MANIDTTEYSSQSEADFALCGHILRKARKLSVAEDALAETIFAVFVKSGLYRVQKEATLKNHTIPNIIVSNPRVDAVKTATDWPEIRTLPDPLPPAPALELTLLPRSIRRFVDDVAKRMQLPVEIVLTPLLIALGSTIGKKLAVQPRSADPTWTEYPQSLGRCDPAAGHAQVAGIERGYEVYSRTEGHCATKVPRYT